MEVICPGCNEPFEQHHANQRYCTYACRERKVERERKARRDEQREARDRESVTQ